MSSTLDPDDRIARRSRIASALTAVAISAVPVGVVLTVGILQWLGGVDPGRAVGVGAIGAGATGAVAALLGWTRAERALDRTAPSRSFVFGTATFAVVLGAIFVAVFFGIGTMTRVPPGDLDPGPLAGAFAYGLTAVAAWSLIALLSGLLAFGLPALPVATGVVWLWVRLVRRLIQQRVPTAAPPTERSATVPNRLSPAYAIAWLAIFVAAVVAGAEAAARVVSNDPPGILHGALIAWVLAFIGPALVAAVGLRAGIPGLSVTGAAGLVGLAFASTPVGVIGFVASGACLAIAAARMGRGPGAALVPVLVVAALLVSAPAALVLSTERVCWDVYDDLSRVMRIWPDEPNGPSEVQILRSGCNAHSYSATGAANRGLHHGRRRRGGSRRRQDGNGPSPSLISGPRWRRRATGLWPRIPPPAAKPALERA